MPDDDETQDVARMYTIACIAKEFGVLPSVVAKDLDDDPEQLSLECLKLLSYAEAKSVYDSGNKSMIDAREDSPVMQEVIKNDFAMAEEKMLEARKAQA